MHGAEDRARRRRLGKPLLGAARPRRGLAVGEVDDADAIPLRRQQGQRAATADFDVVGMGADRDHIERLGKGVHGLAALTITMPASWRRSGNSG